MLLLGGGFVFSILGARLGTIHLYGTDQPFADQWAAEGVGFLQAPLHDKLNWSSFFWPHGEHRPAVTRFITRGLIVANEGQWDCYLEIVFNLLISAVYLMVAWWTAMRVGGGRWVWATLVMMVLLFAQPCAYENLLWGFQSQFLFLLLCGMLHVFATLKSPRLDWWWVAAQFAGLCGLFSIAAGVASPAILAVLAGGGILRGRRDAWAWGTLLINGALLAYGLWLLPAGIISGGDHAGHLARTFIHAACLLSWPIGGSGWFLLVYAPWIVALISWCLGRVRSIQDDLVVGLGGWVVVIALIVGYGRPLTPETIGVRYYDFLIAGVFVNALILIKMLTASRFAWLWKGLGLVWLIMIGTGYWRLNNPVSAGAMLRQQKIYALEQRDVIRKFLATDDPASLEEFSNRTHRFPHFALTLDLLGDPEVRPFLPPSLAVGGKVGPLSRFASEFSRYWMALLGVSMALMLVAAFLPKAVKSGGCGSPAE